MSQNKQEDPINKTTTQQEGDVIEEEEVEITFMESKNKFYNKKLIKFSIRNLRKKICTWYSNCNIRTNLNISIFNKSLFCYSL